MSRPNYRSARLLAIALAYMPVVTAVGAGKSLSSPSSRPSAVSKDEPFVVMSSQDASVVQLIECPNHNFGKPEDGLRVLKERLTHARRPTLAQLCVNDQDTSLKMYAPLVDRVGINPYAQTAKMDKTLRPELWPGIDHPLINRLRVVRAEAGDVRLLARVDVDSREQGVFAKRVLAWPEVEWLALAAIGADFDGLIWVEHSTALYAEQIAQIDLRLGAHAAALGAAEPVGWAKDAGGNPVSSLLATADNHRGDAGDVLFVVLLNPGFVRIDAKNQVPLPPELPACHFDLSIELPDGKSVRDATTLAGRRVKPVFGKSPGSITLRHRFSGGADMIIFNLADSGIIAR